MNSNNSLKSIKNLMKSSSKSLNEIEVENL